MTVTQTQPAGSADSTMPPDAHVVDPAGRARRVRLTVTFALMTLLLIWWARAIDDPSVSFILGDKVTADERPRPLEATWISWSAVGLAAGATLLAALGHFPRRLPRRAMGVVVAVLLYLGVLMWIAAEPRIDLAGAFDEPTDLVLILLIPIVLGALASLANESAGAVLGGLVGLMFYLGFLMWVYSDQGEGFQAAIANPIPGTMLIATPIVLGALAGCLCERAGVINIAIEGQFLAGAFFASVFTSYATASIAVIPLAWCAPFGLVGGALAGILIAAMLGLFALRYQVNQVVLGVVLVAFALGLTSFLLGQIPGNQTDKFNNPERLEPIEIPVLSDLPVVGQSLFNQTLLVYLMYASVALVAFLLFQTKWGLRVRSVGEHPQAADTVGIKVNRVRWQAVLLGGLFAGLGGAYYTVGSTGAFDRNISEGTGFIALAAVIMGRWHPIGATLAAVFFGFMWNLQDQLGSTEKVPTELLGAAPYLATIIAVAGFVGRVRPPAADGEPYVKS